MKMLGVGSLGSSLELPIKISRGDPIELNSGNVDTPEKIEKAAEDFEGLLLQQMFDAMWSSVPSGGLLAGGNEGEYYRDLLTQELSKEIAHSQSLGLKKIFAEDMFRINGAEGSNRKLGIG
jgi:Rod binding domain-containing protein